MGAAAECAVRSLSTTPPASPARPSPPPRLAPARLLPAARKLWSSYFPQVDAVVYLVDAMDRERFPEAKKELDVRALRGVPGGSARMGARG